MLSTFCVCLHHTQFIPHSFILEFCRDFQFVTAPRMPEENQKLYIFHPMSYDDAFEHICKK